MEPWLENFARASFRRSADTAHDLKTPLNIAVLNLELLRMRIRKIADDGDEKLAEYTRAIEAELRRMGTIFDAFFLLSTPPHHDEQPGSVDVASIFEHEAVSHGFAVEPGHHAAIEAHESRIRQACKLFLEGTTRLLREEDRVAVVSVSSGCYGVSVSGRLRSDDIELVKAFKLYHSDAEGNPDLSLAVARLIVETYGGELSAAEDHDNVALRLSFPLGAR